MTPCQIIILIESYFLMWGLMYHILKYVTMWLEPDSLDGQVKVTLLITSAIPVYNIVMLVLFLQDGLPDTEWWRRIVK